MSHRRFARRVWAVVAGALAGAALAVAATDGRPGAPAAGGGWHGSLLPEGVRAPAVVLRDERARPVRTGGTPGTPAVVTFLTAVCRDACPLAAQQIRGALDRVGRDVPVIAVSVDPEADTPEAAQRFLLRQRLTGRMRFALGSRAQLRPVWRAYGIEPHEAATLHRVRVVLVDARGRQRLGYQPGWLTAEGLAADLRRLLGRALPR